MKTDSLHQHEWTTRKGRTTMEVCTHCGMSKSFFRWMMTPDKFSVHPESFPCIRALLLALKDGHGSRVAIDLDASDIPLDPDVESLCAEYAHGSCHILAYALSHLDPYAHIVVFASKPGNIPVHSSLFLRDWCVDACGLRSVQDSLQQWSGLSRIHFETEADALLVEPDEVARIAGPWEPYELEIALEDFEIIAEHILTQRPALTKDRRRSRPCPSG